MVFNGDFIDSVSEIISTCDHGDLSFDSFYLGYRETDHVSIRFNDNKSPHKYKLGTFVPVC